MADKYCSAQFKTGEELDAALKAALDTCDYSVAASECRQAAEKHRAEAEVSEHNAEVYAEGGTPQGHAGEVVLQGEIPGAKGYMEQAEQHAGAAEMHKFAANIHANNAKAYAEGGTPREDVGDGMFMEGTPTLGAKGYVDQAKVYVEGGEAPMTPPELGDGVVRSHGAKNLADRAAAYSVGGDYREYYRGGTWETIHVEKGAMQYAEDARLAAEQAAKGVQDAANSAAEAENFAIEARNMYMNAADAYSGAAAASGWAKTYKDEAAESATAAAKSAEEAKNAAASGGGVSSWNDLTDKPFGYVEADILAETTLEFDDTGAAYLTNPLGLNAGAKCTVAWNGAEYVCTCQYYAAEGMAGLVVGNLGALSGGGSTGEPFVIVDGGETMFEAMGFYGMVACLTGDGSAAVAVKSEFVKPIDTMYLPKHLQFGYVMGDVLPECQPMELDQDEDGVVDGFVLTQEMALTVGKTYAVNYNGTEYPCVAQDISALAEGLPAVGLGNLAELGFAGNDEPFAIMYSPEMMAVVGGEGVTGTVMAADGAETVVLSIKGEVLKPIDSKYLPEGVPCVETFGEPVLPTVVVPDNDLDLVRFITEPVGEVVVGRTYTVTLDETKYECVAEIVDLNDVPAVQLALMDGSENVGVVVIIPPAYVADVGYTAVVSMVDTRSVTTLSIDGGFAVRKLDERCMPDGFLREFVETDPTVPDWAKQPTKPTYTPEEVGVPEWARAETKPTYTANEVGAISNDFPIFTGAISMDRTPDSKVGNFSVAAGCDVEASGFGSQAFGQHAVASGYSSHAAGYNTKATGDYAQAEGKDSEANGRGSHAEGICTVADAESSHAEGSFARAAKHAAHAEGLYTLADGAQSHAEGYHTTAASSYQHVQGKWNEVDDSGMYAHIVGNGTAEIPSNAHTLDWGGNAWFAGSVECTHLYLTSSGGRRYRINITDTGEFEIKDVTPTHPS